MKCTADQKRLDREFEPELHYFGPHKILQRLGQVAYKLDLSADSRIYPVFHVSQLKRKLSEGSTPQSTLPSTDDQWIPVSLPHKLLDERIVKVGQSNIKEVLVQWEGSTTANATWNRLLDLKRTYPNLVGKVL
ncbi:hypothetical protein Pint_05185 [Pistacia integerrima]|uniref:Uncharacterized protein n=1 Tax=Pistacia integerrima TaxID=434235 RepID=A0ACC0Z0H8_9ROSI|nr:hypothetical protein Pint_05185 [Pistacia integerrima]